MTCVRPSSIYGSSSTLISKYDALPKEQQLKLLGEIQEDSEWLIRMVENLLSVTRIDGAKVEVVKMPTVLDELIDSVLMKFSKKHPNQKVITQIPEEFVDIPMDSLLIEQVLCAETCALGMMMYASHHPDLIVLDLGLPDRDGMSLIQEVRKTDTVPIIVLSARSNERDKVEALDLGANDYITKPFGTEELLARIRAVLRSHRHNEENESTPGGKFCLQDLLIDYDKRQVFVGKDEIDLTQTEYNIMAYLSIHAGKVLTYAAIIRAVWGYSDYGGVKKLQVNMKNIRKKMGVTPGEKRYIINELGVGYRMLVEDEA